MAVREMLPKEMVKTTVKVGNERVQIPDYVAESGNERWVKEHIERELGREERAEKMDNSRLQTIADDVYLDNMQDMLNKQNMDTSSQKSQVANLKSKVDNA